MLLGCGIFSRGRRFERKLSPKDIEVLSIEGTIPAPPARIASPPPYDKSKFWPAPHNLVHPLHRIEKDLPPIPTKEVEGRNTSETPIAEPLTKCI